MKKFFLITFISILLYACPNSYVNEGCSKSTYSFEIPVSFEPPDSIIAVGDTVTIISYFPKVIKDKDLGENFIFDSINFFISNGFIKLDTLIENNKHYSFTDDFNFIIDSIYYFRKGNNFIFLDYFYSGDDYLIKYKFVPKKRGIYLFEFSSNINLTQSYRYQIITTENEKCMTNRWYPDIITNKGKNNNKELLKQSPTEYYNTRFYNEWSRFNNIYGAHCFKVVE